MSKAAARTISKASATDTGTNPSNVDLLLKKETAAVVAIAREHYSVENGNGKFSDEFYESTLPTDVTVLDDIVIPQKDLMAIELRLQKHHSVVIAASALVHGEHALAAAVKDPSLQVSSVKFKVGNNTVAHVFKREGESRNPQTGVKSKTFATVKSSVIVQGAKGASGELGRVRKHISTLGAAVLV